MGLDLDGFGIGKFKYEKIFKPINMSQVLFLGYTPYHILNSLSIADPADNNTLICFRDFDDGILYNNVKELSLFDTCHLLHGDYGAENDYLRKNILRKYSIYELNSIVDLASLDSVIMGKDTKLQSLYIIEHSKTSGCEYIYMEDGMAAYTEGHPRNLSFVNYIFSLIYYGRYATYMQDNSDLHPSISKSYVLFPSLVHDGIKQTRVQNIPTNRLTSEYGEFCRGILQELGIVQKILPLDILFLVPFSSSLSRGNVRRLNDIISDLSKNYKLGIKYHPREYNKAFLESDNNVLILPDGLPAEILFLSDIKFEYIIGTGSTALLTSKHYTNSRIISIANLVDIEISGNIEKIFEKLGVEIPDSVATFYNTM